MVACRSSFGNYPKGGGRVASSDTFPACVGSNLVSVASRRPAMAVYPSFWCIIRGRS